MNRLNLKLCIHCTWLFIAVVGGAFVVAGWVPPPSENLTAEATRQIFTNAPNVRAAAAMFFFGGALFVIPAAAITTQMRRIEGARHVLADLQIVSAAIGVLAIMIPGALWLAVSFRNDTPASTVAFANDVCWFLLLGAVGSAVVENVCIAACILGGDGRIYPRWLGYLNVCLALALMPGILIPFFKTGPFAWNGIVGFWLVALAFFAWMIIMWAFTSRAIDVGDNLTVDSPETEPARHRGTVRSLA